MTAACSQGDLPLLIRRLADPSMFLISPVMKALPQVKGPLFWHLAGSTRARSVRVCALVQAEIGRCILLLLYIECPRWS